MTSENKIDKFEVSEAEPGFLFSISKNDCEASPRKDTRLEALATELRTQAGISFISDVQVQDMPGFISFERDPIDGLEDSLPTTIPGACRTVLMALAWAANFEPGMFKGTKTDRGDVCISQNTLCKHTGHSRKTVRNALEVLKATKSITQKGAIKGAKGLSVYHIDIYEYIIHKFDGGPLRGPTRGQQGATSKEEEVRRKKEHVPSPLVELEALLPTSKVVENSSKTIEEIAARYNLKVSPKARLIDNAKEKIKVRLKTYSKDDLLTAIDRFASDPWRMEHNAKEGMTWFFWSDEQIEKFLALGSSFVAHDENGKAKLVCPKCGGPGRDGHDGTAWCWNDPENHAWEFDGVEVSDEEQKAEGDLFEKRLLAVRRQKYEQR